MFKIVLDNFCFRIIIAGNILHEISGSGGLAAQKQFHQRHIAEFAHYSTVVSTDISVKNIAHIRFIWF